MYIHILCVLINHMGTNSCVYNLHLNVIHSYWSSIVNKGLVTQLKTSNLVTFYT